MSVEYIKQMAKDLSDAIDGTSNVRDFPRRMPRWNTHLGALVRELDGLEVLPRRLDHARPRRLDDGHQGGGSRHRTWMRFGPSTTTRVLTASLPRL